MKMLRMFLLVFVFCGCVFSNAALTAAERSYKLNEEVSLPTGKGHVVLKAGSIVTVNSRGYVLKGILSKDQFVNAVRISMRFKGGTEIVFSESGHVMKGTILSDESIPNGRSFFRYRGETEVELDERGYVRTGVLLANQLSTTANGQKCLIKAGSLVSFKDGFVKTCFLAQSQTFSNGVFLTSYLSGTQIVFNDNGYVVSGVLAEKQVIRSKQYYKGDWIRFNKDGVPIS